jgi:hypothetical protein
VCRPVGLPRLKWALEPVVHVVRHFIKDFFTEWATLHLSFGTSYIRYFGYTDADHTCLVVYMRLL